MLAVASTISCKTKFHNKGKRLKGVAGDQNIYCSVCLDTVGPMRVSHNLGYKFVRKVYLLVCVDLFSSLGTCFVIDDITAKNIGLEMLALHVH